MACGNLLTYLLAYLCTLVPVSGFWFLVSGFWFPIFIQSSFATFMFGDFVDAGAVADWYEGCDTVMYLQYVQYILYGAL